LSDDVNTPKQEKRDNMLFKAPEDYNDMSEEEREQATKEMMSRYRSWAGNALTGK